MTRVARVVERYEPLERRALLAQLGLVAVIVTDLAAAARQEARASRLAR